MAEKTEYGRYNPSPKNPGYPYQYKAGRLGRARRSNVVTQSPRLRRRLKANKGKWLPLVG